MFNPLTRALKLGLTAITILTAGGFAFAPTAEAQTAEVRPTEAQIANCNANPFGTGVAYGEGGCGVTLLLDSERWSAAKEQHCNWGTNRMTPYCNNPTSVRWNAAKEEYCNRGNNSSLAVCRPTAVRWKFENPTAPSSASLASRNNQFLKGTATGLNKGDTRVWEEGTLNLNTAEFNGEALGGKATHGMAFFRAGGIHYYRANHYAGILLGTDLGNPIIETRGTASWVGSFSAVGGDNFLNKTVDFVLDVDFGEKTVDTFVPGFSGRNFFLNGSYDDSGIITGTVHNGSAVFVEGHRNTRSERNGRLTGLIGQKGAVGVFISYDSAYSGRSTYSGGFVARPADQVTGAVAHLEKTCKANPFHQFCFLDYAEEREPLNIIHNCGGTLTTDSPSYCNEANSTCVDDPFGAGCAAILVGKTHTIAKVQYCGNNPTNPNCTLVESGYTKSILERPTAANWASKIPVAETSVLSLYTGSIRRPYFIRGTGRGVDNTGVFISSDPGGALNLDTNTFNNKSLGGDSTDGVVFGRYESGLSSNVVSISAILSGTDLGAPVTETVGTASWVGQFSARYLEEATDFVLEVTFRDAEDIAGSIKAFVGFLHPSGNYSQIGNYYLNGTFDKSGLIKGSVYLARFENNDRNNFPETTSNLKHELTGLIGQEGAVGVFHRGGSLYPGGFVARPAGLVTGAQAFLDKTCATAKIDANTNVNNPFHRFCFLSNERALKIIENCSGARTSSSPGYCTNTVISCVNDPFGTGCSDTLGGHALNIARTNRIEFCDNTDNGSDSRCTGTKLTNLCNYIPFLPICVGNTGSDMARKDNFEDCRMNPSKPTCHGIKHNPDPKPNTANWLDSFVTANNFAELPSVADTTMRSQFLKGGETDLVQAAIPRLRETDELYLNADNFNDTLELLTPEVPTDTTDGVAFAFGRNSANQNKFYAGILSGTDLGEPITGISETKAVWEGTFQSVWVATKTKFDLEITFGNDKTGSIEAFIERKTSDKFYSIVPHFHLKGTFDSNGLITGKVITARFPNKTPVVGYNYLYTGILRGLIGKEGAVGAFVGGTSTDKGNTITGTSVFSGGFVARVSTVDYADWEGAAAPLDAILATGNQFLSGGLLNRTRTSTKLNLRHAKYNGYLLNGDSRDGVAFFKSQPTTGQASYYAGIFSGTDLGAPVTQTGKSAYWSGRFQVVDNDGVAPSVGFVLRVNFGNAGDKAGSISSLVKNAVGTTPVALEGRFTYKGVITGTARLDGSLGTTSGSEATMKGLIGQDGAVGVFIADDGQTPFSGGFVARPHSVNIEDLRNYATLETTPSRALNGSGGFLNASLSNGELDTARGHFPSGFYLTDNSDTIGRRDGDTDDGYQYFGIVNDAGETEVSRYYAGILSTTNLGAPLVAPVDGAPTTATWEGHVSFGVVAKEFPTNFNLNFAAGTIGFATGRATIIEPSNSSIGVHLTLNGKFGPGDSSLSLGQLGGDMRVSTVGNGNTPLPITGLIGQDGVVGVFVNPSATSGSAGGFVGQPKQ